MIHGRESERQVIEELLDAARGGSSGVLLISGEAGIGKSVLCRYAREAAEGFRTLSARGVESESKVACGGLLELIWPVRELVSELPTRQGQVLAGVLGEASGVSSDAFTLGVSLLSLFAVAAEASPLLVVVDDAHWLDSVSFNALMFASRRLEHEAVAIICAARPNEGHSLDGVSLPRLELVGLDVASATSLVEEARGVALDPAVVTRLVEGTGGNPLALLEVAKVLSADVLRGHAPLPDPLLVGGQVGAAFARRIGVLSEAAREALVVVAASRDGALRYVEPALVDLGLERDAFDEGESAGLVSSDGVRIEFVHPVVRSVVYEEASAPARRRAHTALARAAADAGDSQREAWHRAAAAPGPDESVASALEEVALGAMLTGGPSAGAVALERAALLTPAGPQRARRLVAAADALFLSGRTAQVHAYVDEALAQTSDPVVCADAALALGEVVTLTESPATGFRILSDAAKKVEGHDKRRAALLWFAAGYPAGMNVDPAALQAGREIARLARELGDVDLARQGSALTGIMLLTYGRTDEASAVLDANRHEPGYVPSLPVVQPTEAQCLMWLERYEDARRLVEDVVATARAAGDIASLPHCLTVQSELQFHTGAWQAARASATEAVRLAEDTGQRAVLAFALSFLARIEAGLGLEQDAREHAQVALSMVDTGQTGRSVEGFAGASLGLVALAAGTFGDAEFVVTAAVRHPREWGNCEPSAFRAGADAVELLIRAGNEPDATNELAQFRSEAEHTSRIWAKAAALRCRGLLPSCEREGGDLYPAALELHDQTSTPFERARTLLGWGEWLRRNRQRRDAANRLREALAIFERLGADPWAERARRELRATGESMPSRSIESRLEVLTAQELQVALTVAAGLSNKEAAAQLFLSPKTIEYHLSAVYRKLEITSRGQLAPLIAAEQPDVS